MLGREVVQLGTVDLDVVELPRVVVEVAPAADRRMGGDRLPPVVPDRPRSEHRVELSPAASRDVSVVEAVAHADPVEVGLDVALDRLRRLDAEALEDVGTRSIAWWYWSRISPVAVIAFGQEIMHGSLRAAVELVALPHLERRVERHRPPVRVVVVGLRAAEVVDQREVRLDVVRHAVDELVLVERAVRAALAAGAVVGHQHDQRVLELLGLLEIFEQPADLIVDVRRGTRRTPRPCARTAAARRPTACPTGA